MFFEIPIEKIKTTEDTENTESLVFHHLFSVFSVFSVVKKASEGKFSLIWAGKISLICDSGAALIYVSRLLSMIYVRD